MIKEWIKLNIFKVMLIALIASIALNIFAFTWKGIVVNKTYTTNNHQEQMQYQGQLVIYGNIVQGNKVEIVGETYESFDELKTALKIIPIAYMPQWDFNCIQRKYELTYYKFMEKK